MLGFDREEHDHHRSRFISGGMNEGTKELSWHVVV
jgi:hypothetical protein